MGAYTEKNIFTPERLDYVRMRPTAFFNSTGTEGLVHQALEITTNSIDEIALMPELAGKVVVLLCVDQENDTYQLVVKDNGRGLPIKRLLDSFTKLHTSGKFDQTAYETSGGLFGQGAKASCGTSRHFKAITHRRDTTSPEPDVGSAAIYVKEGQTDEVVEFIGTSPAQTGVTVLFEPDPIIFPTDIPLFAVDGQAQLLSILQKYCFFRRLNIEFRVYPLGLPSSVWTDPISAVEETIATLIQAAHLVFGEADFDRTAWIREYWSIHRPFSLQHVLRDSFSAVIPGPNSQEINIRYEVRLYSVKFDTIGGRFGMVNNVAIDDAKSTHFLTVMDVVKLALSAHIKDAPVRKFFLEQYRVPLCVAVDIKFPGAEFSGTTKHAFISRPFRTVYEPSLQRQLSAPEGVAFVEALYLQLADDIEAKYTIEMTGVSKPKNFNRLFEDFEGLSQRFKDCRTTNRLSAELFLVEGNSAGSSVTQGRNSDNQGIYLLRGKPLNAITDRDGVRQSAIEVRNNPIYKEILAITGINPAKFDHNTLNFGRINILTDADDHGQHIAAILVANFYVVCPDIITSGMVHVVTPPLYSLRYTGRKNQSLPNIYFRDQPMLQKWMIENVYLKYLDIGIRVKGCGDKTYSLPQKECVSFLRSILDIGEAIDNIAAELVLEPSIVERLTYVSGALDPTRGEVDMERLKAIPDIDRVSYDKDANILVLTVGKDDHIIPLQNVWKRLVEVILPKMNRINWRKTQIYITTKNSAEFKDSPVSVTKLCAILQILDNQFTTERYKGLGSMQPDDMGRTCMDPERRTIHQITSVGDIVHIFNLLGSDSGPRKKLIIRN